LGTYLGDREERGECLPLGDLETQGFLRRGEDMPGGLVDERSKGLIDSLILEEDRNEVGLQIFGRLSSKCSWSMEGSNWNFLDNSDNYRLI